jgi:hypothetical protein
VFLLLLRMIQDACSCEQVEEFDQTGFLLPLRAISEKEAAEVRGKIEHAEVQAQQGGNGLFTNAHTLYDWFYDLATKESVVDVVEDLIGPNIMIWKSQLWIKESGSGSYVGWVRLCFSGLYIVILSPLRIAGWPCVTRSTAGAAAPRRTLLGPYSYQLRECLDCFDGCSDGERPDGIFARLAHHSLPNSRHVRSRQLVDPRPGNRLGAGIRNWATEKVRHCLRCASTWSVFHTSPGHRARRVT